MAGEPSSGTSAAGVSNRLPVITLAAVSSATAVVAAACFADFFICIASGFRLYSSQRFTLPVAVRGSGSLRRVIAVTCWLCGRVP